MFCEFCGKEISNENGQCPYCSTSVSSKTIIKKNFKFLLPVLLFILALAAVLLFNANSINSSPEKVAIAAVESEYEADVDKMIKCFPDFMIKEIAYDCGLSPNASKKKVVSSLKEDYRYASVNKVSNANATVIAECDAEDYILYKEMYAYMTDNDMDAIKKVARVEVSFVVDGDNKCVDLICIEMNNKWYFLKRAY